MKIIISLAFILMLSFPALAQKEEMRVVIGSEAQTLEVRYSSVFDIRKFVKYCVDAESSPAQDTPEIIAQFLLSEPSIKFVNKCDEAEFRIQYREQDYLSQMRVFYIKDKTVWIVWAEDLTMKKAEKELAGEFLKILRRNKNLDKKMVPGKSGG